MKWKRNQKCKRCGRCCTFFVVKLQESLSEAAYKNKMIFNDLSRYFKFHNCLLFWHREPDGKMVLALKVPIVCKQLTATGRCKIHKQKPLCCVNFPSDDEFMYLLDGCGFK